MNKLKVSLVVIGLLLGGTGWAGTAYTSGGQATSVTVAKFWPSK